MDSLSLQVGSDHYLRSSIATQKDPWIYTRISLGTPLVPFADAWQGFSLVP